MALILPATPLVPGDRVAVAPLGRRRFDGAGCSLCMRPTRCPGTRLASASRQCTSTTPCAATRSEADQRFVEELCGRLDIPLHLHRADTHEYAAQHKQTIEEAARNLRYAFFAELFAQGKANKILTAHTLDDQAETVLMKLLRGAWLEGLSAIAPVLEVPGGKILRPLLNTRREELRGYLRGRHQPWRDDSSNSDEAFTRNRIRHTVLPVLREEETPASTRRSPTGPNLPAKKKRVGTSSSRSCCRS